MTKEQSQRTGANSGTQFVRVAETGRAAVSFTIDGAPAEALVGDTVLTALLCNGTHVRESEFGDGPRAGFCVMGACQDCWVSLESGEQLRACTTYIKAGMRLVRPRNQP